MRSWLAGMTVLALGIAASAQDSGDANKKTDSSRAQPDDEKKDAAAAEAKKKFAALKDESEKLEKDTEKEFMALKAQDRQKLRNQFIMKLTDARAEFAEKALQIAKTLDPADKAAFEPLLFAMERGLLGRGAEVAEEAKKLLLSNHEDHPEFGIALSMVATSGPTGIATVEKTAKESKSRNARGAAYYLLALNKQEKAASNRLNEEQIEELRKSAQGYFEILVKDYADVEGPRAKLGVLAKRALTELVVLKVGNSAPEVTCLNIDSDKQDKLSNYKGKVVVLDIWATWCGPCVAMIPHETRMVKNLEHKKFVLISISADDDKETLVKFLEKTKMPWVHWFAEGKGILQDWNIHAYPTIYVIDHKGVIRARDLRGDRLEEKVEELLAEMEK